MVKLTGKLKSFSLHTVRVCIQCKNIIKWQPGGRYLCPEHGALGWREIRRVWFGMVSLDTFDFDVDAIFRERAVSQILARAGMSWQMSLNRLKGLRGEAWLKTFQEIKREVEQKARQYLVGQILTLTGSWSEKVFAVRKLASTVSAKPSEEGSRFVAGKLEELRAVTDRVLRDYNLEMELWEGTPVLRFKRKIEGENIVIGIRAPLREYAKSYHIWVRINDVHMYPAKPIQTGRGAAAWVLRAYHTRGWEQKIEELLTHCLGLEDHAVRVVKAARKIPVDDARRLLSPELTQDQKDEIIEGWQGGSLWKLAEEANKINRTAGLFVLKEYGLLKDFQ